MLVIVMLLAACGVQVMDYDEPEDYPLIEDIAYSAAQAADVYEHPDDEAEEEYAPEPRESPEPLTFVTTMRLHEDMPEFTFRHTVEGDLEVPEEWWPEEWWEAREAHITIEDEQGNVVQEIFGLIQTNTWGWDSHTDMFQLIFEDLNFDGYLDMHLVAYPDPGTGMFTDRYFWLWDAEQGQFVQNRQLSEIVPVYRFYSNQETRQIVVQHRLGHVHHIMQYFEHHNGEFALVLTIERVVQGGNSVYTYTDEQTGEVTERIVPREEVESVYQDE